MSDLNTKEVKKLKENNNEISNEKIDKLETESKTDNSENQNQNENTTTENNSKRKKTTSSLDKFGSRILKDESKVFDYNAWY